MCICQILLLPLIGVLGIFAAHLLFILVNSTFCLSLKDESFYEAVYKLDYLDAVFNESLRLYPPAWQYDHFIAVAFVFMSLCDVCPVMYLHMH